MRPDVHGGESAKGGSDPVDDDVLHGSVAAATELETGGQHGVEVASTITI